MNLIAVLIAGGGEGGHEALNQTHHWLLPETAEIIYGGLASVLVIGALVKFAGPVAKKAFAARTERIQNEIDSARDARAKAEGEASDIRKALGDINSERARLIADADAQASALLTEGRSRIAAEMADMEAKANADIDAATARGADELRAEISRLAALATERVVAASLDTNAQQSLVEGFISKVGA